MTILYMLLVLIGLLMLIKPNVFWKLTESWKSNDAMEPSFLYVMSTRLGGGMCALAGIAGIIANYAV
ncbi:DUF6199 family natural product biosynthesis protein [Paenibacillus sp. MBLB4367]|uniref:DUF6199 family natural product biosynthesis protein n=1 Tax=Paenibacillus sp. MBLB4367 TaxID=3384767 RepID=UPI003907FB79